MGTTIWLALESTFVNYDKADWSVVETDGRTTTMRNRHEPDNTVFVTNIADGIYIVILEE